MSFITNIKSSTPISITTSQSISKSHMNSKINNINYDNDTEYINSNIHKITNIIPERIDIPTRSPSISIPKFKSNNVSYDYNFQLGNLPDIPIGKTPPDNDLIYRIYLNYISNKNISSF